MRPELRPVDLPTSRYEHEHVVVRAAAHDDGPEQLPHLDSLESGALLDAARPPCPNQLVAEPGTPESANRRRLHVHAVSVAVWWVPSTTPPASSGYGGSGTAQPPPVGSTTSLRRPT